MNLQTLVPVLQVAVGPVILISGVGLLLLSMTNRFGRIIDRVRQLHGDSRESSAGQLDILMRRAVLLRAAITLATISVLLAAILIISLFVATLMNANAAAFLAATFILSLLSLILSLLLFLSDLNLSLTALKLEAEYLRVPNLGQSGD